MKKDIIKKNFIKKRIFLIIGVILLFVLLFPIRYKLKDGGTIEYRSLIYSVYKVHSLTSLEEMEKGKVYNEGLIIEIFGQEIYNTVQ
jgi:hypothetical protein